MFEPLLNLTRTNHFFINVTETNLVRKATKAKQILEKRKF